MVFGCSHIELHGFGELMYVIEVLAVKLGISATDKVMWIYVRGS